MKYIREARMGAPKSFKTGAVVGTYPKPMLCLMFDEGGLDIVPPKGTVVPPGLVQFDCTAEDIEWCSVNDLMARIQQPLPKILALNFFPNKALTIELKQVADSRTMQSFVNTVDLLRSMPEPFPFKTVVLDSVTGYMEVVLSLIAQVNPSGLTDARIWAHQVGVKVKQAVMALTTLKAHVVVILHSTFEKNEITGTVSELPSVYSNLRQELSYLFSQFFYATKRGTKPVIWTQDQQFVRGVGNRWPVGLPAECGPDFKSIYGSEAVSLA